MGSHSESTLDVSVVVCTRNRAASLCRLLDSFRDMDVPPDLAWEIVIVDNGSSDNTAEMVASVRDALPIRYSVEERAGVSNARNHAVSIARGRYLCWTDDDATVDKAWLTTYLKAFQAYPDAAVFGGRVSPVIEGPSPRWIIRYSSRWPISDLLARRDFGSTPQPIDFRRGLFPFGVNFAVRAEEQRQHRYDPNLGVSPEQKRSAEESQLMFDIVSAGACGWWLPDSEVHHHFPRHRQTFKYLFEHYAAIGESQAYLDATRHIHIMNQDGSDNRLSEMNSAILWVRHLINLAGYRFCRAIGLTLRSTYYLRKSGFYKGAYSYIGFEKYGKRKKPSLFYV